MPRPKPPKPSKALRNALSKPGVQSEIARKLKISRQAVGSWATGASVLPLNRVLQLEKILGIPREDLRPDLYKLMRAGRAS
jgi:DNA-binding transcriptional regulator YdaS (Cro superfamily)